MKKKTKKPSPNNIEKGSPEYLEWERGRKEHDAANSEPPEESPAEEKPQARTTIREAMQANPRGNECSICNAKVPNVPKGVAACVCASCIAAIAFGPKRIKEIHEEQKAKRAAKPKKVGAIEAITLVMEEAGRPMHIKNIFKALTEKDLWFSKSSTPLVSLYASIALDMKNNKDSRFVKSGKSIFSLK